MKSVIIFIILLFFSLMICGCSTNKYSTISNNMYYQTDYNYFCFDGDKTWSQIIVCLNAEGKAERTQNQITNDLLSQN